MEKFFLGIHVLAPVLFVPAILFFAACGGEKSVPKRYASLSASQSSHRVENGFTSGSEIVQSEQKKTPPPKEELLNSIEALAEMERSGSFRQGMALAESGLRENAGDFAGAVAAAYKELAWAYGLGKIPKETLRQGLENVLTLREGGLNEAAKLAAQGILAFADENWAGAEKILSSVFDDEEETDSFARWMLLVCALEQNGASRQLAEYYRAIRARYAHFPEYWYRGAQIFQGGIGADYAERCVSLAPEGPFAAPCRNMLAAWLGLKNADSSALKTKFEIEELVSKSVTAGNPAILDALMPLISLPDNPYTVYAVGALRALSSVPAFRNFFTAQAASSKGRLAERLDYICRG